MTVSTTTNSATFLGNGAQTVFVFSFVWGSPNYLVVTTTTNSVTTVVSPASYTLALNPAVAGQIWGVGGTLTYPSAGSPLAVGSSITITRAVPDQQTVSLSNQGSQTPQSTEMGLDLLEMQIQQVQQEVLQLSGGAPALQTKTLRLITTGTTDTASALDYGIGWNSASSGTKTETIPNAAAAGNGVTYVIKDVRGDSNINVIVITPTSGTIDGVSSFTVNVAKSAITLLSDGISNWIVI